MAGTLRGHGRVILSLALLLTGLLVSMSIDRDDLREIAAVPSERVLEAPELTMTLSRGQLAINGTTRSGEHEAAIAAFATDRFGDRDLQYEFAAGVIVPENWVPISVRLLYVMAAMESATASMRGNQVNLRGVTARADVFRQRLGFLREAMAAGAVLDEDVIVVAADLALGELCQRAFAALGALPVAFAESSTELKASAYPSLDRLVDFAWDCRSARIMITGHTDSSGDESRNLQLSRARAQAVADYLQKNGVDSGRLLVDGRGSAEPVADNRTRYGRSLNRRIEFELRAPLL